MSRTLMTGLLGLVACCWGVSSCVPLAVGAAAGYVARDNGYEVQSPIKKKDQGENYDSAE
jgi:hypothetical protein